MMRIATRLMAVAACVAALHVAATPAAAQTMLGQMVSAHGYMGGIRMDNLYQFEDGTSVEELGGTLMGGQLGVGVTPTVSIFANVATTSTTMHLGAVDGVTFGEAFGHDVLLWDVNVQFRKPFWHEAVINPVMQVGIGQMRTTTSPGWDSSLQDVRTAAEQRRQQQQAQRQANAANESSASGAGAASSGRDGAPSEAGNPSRAVAAGANGSTRADGGTWSKARFVQGDKPVQYQVQMLGTNADGSARSLFRFFVNQQDDINNCGPIADCLGYYLEVKYDWDDPAMKYRNIEFYWFDKNSDAMLTIGPVNVPMLSDARAAAIYDAQEGFQVRYANGVIEHRMPFSACADHRLASYSGHRCLRFEKQIPAVLVR